MGKTVFGCAVYGNPSWNKELRTIKAELKEGYIDMGRKAYIFRKIINKI